MKILLNLYKLALSSIFLESYPSMLGNISATDMLLVDSLEHASFQHQYCCISDMIVSIYLCPVSCGVYTCNWASKRIPH